MLKLYSGQIAGI